MEPKVRNTMPGKSGWACRNLTITPAKIFNIHLPFLTAANANTQHFQAFVQAVIFSLIYGEPLNQLSCTVAC